MLPSNAYAPCCVPHWEALSPPKLHSLTTQGLPISAPASFYLSVQWATKHLHEYYREDAPAPNSGERCKLLMLGDHMQIAGPEVMCFSPRRVIWPYPNPHLAETDHFLKPGKDIHSHSGSLHSCAWSYPPHFTWTGQVVSQSPTVSKGQKRHSTVPRIPVSTSKTVKLGASLRQGRGQRRALSMVLNRPGC